MEADERGKAKVLSYRWLVFILLAFTNFFGFFNRSTVGVMRDAISLSIPMTAISFSLLSSVYFYSYVAMQLPIGIMADTVGVRKTISIGCLVTAAGAIIFGLAPSFEIACVGRVLIGAGVSGPVVCLQKNMTEWFRERERGVISCMGSLAGSLGSMSAQAPLMLLVVAFTWRNTFFILAGMAVLLAILCYRFLRNSPAQMNLPSVESIEGEPEREKAEHIHVLAALKNVLRNRCNWPLFLCFMINVGVYLAFASTWAVSYIKDVFQYSAMEATYYSTVLLAGMAFGTLTIGFVSNLMKSRKKPLILLTLCAITCWSLIVFGNELIKSANLLALIMFFTGLPMSSIPLCFSLIRELNNPLEVGVSIGFINTFALLGGSFFINVVGILINHYSASLSGAALYQKAFLFLMAAEIVCLIAIFATKETHCKNIYADLQAKEKSKTTVA